MTENQLENLLRVLNDNNVENWIDSGTLLGIVRDGHLLESDIDIDVSSHEKEIPKLEQCLGDLRDLGYNIKKKVYRGQVYGYKLTQDGYRNVDLKVFREEGDLLWCPDFVGKKPPKSTHSLIRGLFAIVRYLGYRYWGLSQFVTKDLCSPIAYPARFVIDVKTWCYPKDLLLPISHYKNDFYVPNKLEKYLTYRFNDWKEPVPDWNYKTDDIAFCHNMPEDVVENPPF